MVDIFLPSVVLGVCSHGAVAIMVALDMAILGMTTHQQWWAFIKIYVSHSSREAPVQVQALVSVKVVVIAAGESHSAAITDKGALYTWGRGNYGRLGHGKHSNT